MVQNKNLFMTSNAKFKKKKTTPANSVREKNKWASTKSTWLSA